MTTSLTADLGELFPPKPGGMVDTARKRTQSEADQAAALDGDKAPVPDTGSWSVRVRPEPPDTGTARTITLSSSNLTAQLLPRDMTRRSAVILAIDNDVWISYNQGTAGDLAGTAAAGGAFYLPAGIGIPVDSKAQIWVSPTTTATSSRVSVLASRDSTP